MKFVSYAPNLLLSEDYAVTAIYNGVRYEISCATAVVGNRFHDYSMAYERMSFCSMDCDFEEPLTVEIRPTMCRREAVIRPKHAGIVGVFDGECLTVTLDHPQKLCIEFDGDLFHNLFLFIGTPETELPAPDAVGVRYFGPGVHDVGKIELSSGETLYLHGDAVVYGHIFAQGDDIRILGRGVLTGEHLNHDCDKHREQLLRATGCHHLTIDGVILLDSPAWTVCAAHCSHLTITDMKQICYNPNSDGFDICSCEDVLIRDCMVRNFDDNISIKSFGGDNRNITMEDCILFGDCAHNMLVGPESKREAENHFCHICFRNIDVLEHKEFSEFFMGVMAIFCADNASFYDIEWSDIRVERMAYGRLFDFNYVDAYAETYGKSVRDIRMKNITCDAPMIFRSRINGMDETHTMEDILIENVTVGGRPITADDPAVKIGAFVENVVYR